MDYGKFIEKSTYDELLKSTINVKLLIELQNLTYDN